MKQDIMYIILDEKQDWIFTIVYDLDEAMDLARMMNLEENQLYHHYVVEECTIEYGEAWLEAWKKVIEV